MQWVRVQRSPSGHGMPLNRVVVEKTIPDVVRCALSTCSALFDLASWVTYQKGALGVSALDPMFRSGFVMDGIKEVDALSADPQSNALD